MKKRSGARALIEALEAEKVEYIFGYPGGAVLDIFDEIYKNRKIKFILTRHEQAAAHAADAYARSTGKVGVCIATSGPGATNLVTGIATAYMDSIPIVALTGQVPSSMIGNDAFQEADVTGITRPITKHNYLVSDTDSIPRIVKEAFFIAKTGRPGPVVIDIPKDYQRNMTASPVLDKISIRGYKPNYSGHQQQIKKAAEIINNALKPLLYVGGGVIISDASKELCEIAKKSRIPVTTTLLGLGAFPEADEELSLGMLGMHGTVYANNAVQNSDVIIAVGARFDDRVTGRIDDFAPNAKIIHIDIDPSAISKNVSVNIPIVGDAKLILKELKKYLKKCNTKEWLEQIKKWKKEFPLTYKKEKGKIKPQQIVEELDNLTKGRAIICTEVGQNQMWAAQFYKYTKPRTFISSGGLGTMGFGFPAAIGAKIGNPEKTVIDIAGDGSIQMNIQELATCVQYGIDVKVLILNNGFLGMVRQWQELFYSKRYASTCLMYNTEKCPVGQKKFSCTGMQDCYKPSPDFVKVAQAYGAIGIRIEKEKEIKPKLKEALKKYNVPVFIDCIVEKEENVFPMVPAGASLSQMMSGMA